MNLEVNVKVDLSDRVYELMTRIAGQVKELGVRSTRSTRSKSAKAEAAAEAKADVSAADAVAEPTAADAKADVKAAEAEPVKADVKSVSAAEAEPSAEDVRAAMTACRRRVMGSDWNNPESEAYRLYHKLLVSMFKCTATLHGAAKPSLLAPSARRGFIDDVSRIKVVNGELSDGLSDGLPF